MRFIKILVLSAMAFSLGASAVMSQDDDDGGGGDDGKAEGKKSASYSEMMGMQFVRGLVNMATGWVEIPRQAALITQEEGAWFTLEIGIPKGACMAVVRTCYGAFDAVFFYIPFEEDFGPAVEPEYVWQEWTE